MLSSEERIAVENGLVLPILVNTSAMVFPSTMRVLEVLYCNRSFTLIDDDSW